MLYMLIRNTNVEIRRVLGDGLASVRSRHYGTIPKWIDLHD